MNWTNRKKVRILGYTALFKKLGILNEEEYQSIISSHLTKNKYQ